MNAESRFKITPLLAACLVAEADIIALLLKRGADARYEDNDGVCALDMVRNGNTPQHLACAEVLHRHLARLDKKAEKSAVGACGSCGQAQGKMQMCSKCQSVYCAPLAH